MTTALVRASMVVFATAALVSCGPDGASGDSAAERDVPVVVIHYDAAGTDGSTVADGSHDHAIPDFAWPEVVPDDDPGGEAVDEPAEATLVETWIPADAGKDPGQPVDPGPCTPSCTGKTCGGNGCGGSCGTCQTPQQCVNSKCLCVPDCGGKACGADGCGGTCGTTACEHGCTPPPTPGLGGATEFKCMQYGPCTQTGAIACKDLTKSDTVGFGTSSDKVDLYDCAPGTTPHGPAKIYLFQADGSGDVTFTLSGTKSWVNLYLMHGQCSGTACTGSDFSHSQLTKTVTSGDTWYVAVDSTENNSAAFTLDIACTWFNPNAE